MQIFSFQWGSCKLSLLFPPRCQSARRAARMLKSKGNRSLNVNNLTSKCQHPVPLSMLTPRLRTSMFKWKFCKKGTYSLFQAFESWESSVKWCSAMKIINEIWEENTLSFSPPFSLTFPLTGARARCTISYHILLHVNTEKMFRLGCLGCIGQLSNIPWKEQMIIMWIPYLYKHADDSHPFLYMVAPSIKQKNTYRHSESNL